MQNDSLISRDTILCEVRALLAKPNFDHQTSARVDRLINLADRLSSPNGATLGNPEMRKFDGILRSAARGNAAEWRDLGVSVTTAGGYLVPQGFYDSLTSALAQYDRLFDADISTVIETANGSPFAVPAIDDTSSAASAIVEAGLDSEVDTTAQQVLLPSAPTYRSGVVKVSHELLGDSAFDVTGLLAKSFGVRYGRGIGPDLVTALLAGAKLGVTAAGASAITYGELIKLRTSVDPAYRASGKVSWILNDNTLAYIDSLTSSTGQPIIEPEYDAAGNRTLLGFKVAISPSMPDIGASKKPLAFGATGYLLVRKVPSAFALKPLFERWAEYGQVGYASYLRCGAALIAAAGADSPVKYLQNHS